MTSIENPETKSAPVYLVTDRADFIVVYLSSLGTLITLVLGAWFVQTPNMPLSEIWYVLPIAAFIALLPPLVARFLKTGRRVNQFLFGALLAPFVGALVINGLSILKALQW